MVVLSGLVSGALGGAVSSGTSLLPKLDYILAVSSGAVLRLLLFRAKVDPVKRWKCTILYICGDAFATAAGS